jgi:hypothetical protein
MRTAGFYSDREALIGCRFFSGRRPPSFSQQRAQESTCQSKSSRLE